MKADCLDEWLNWCFPAGSSWPYVGSDGEGPPCWSGLPWHADDRGTEAAVQPWPSYYHVSYTRIQVVTHASAPSHWPVVRPGKWRTHVEEVWWFVAFRNDRLRRVPGWTSWVGPGKIFLIPNPTLFPISKIWKECCSRTNNKDAII